MYKVSRTHYAEFICYNKFVQMKMCSVGDIRRTRWYSVSYRISDERKKNVNKGCSDKVNMYLGYLNSSII